MNLRYQFYLMYEGEDGGSVTTEPAPAGEPAPVLPTEPIAPTNDGANHNDPEPKGVPQADVNRIVKNERDKYQTQAKRAIEELEALQTQATMGKDERDGLEARIKDMKSQILSKEEQLKEEREKFAREQKDIVSNLTNDRDLWKSQFEDSTIKRGISDAASEFEAHNANQIQAILAPNTRLVEELNDLGEPTGVSIPTVKFSTKDNDGKPITLDLTVPEAVERMKDMDEYFNLFRAQGTGGVGQMNSRTMNNSPTRIEDLAKTDPARYRELRASGELELE